MSDTTSTNTTTKQIATGINLDMGGSLTIAVANGKSIIVRVEDLSPEIQLYATLHGLKQKIIDAAALGAGATLTDKYVAMSEVVDRLMAGEWNKRGEGGTGTPTGLLFKALCRLYGDSKSPETIRTFLGSKDKSEQAALRKNPRIAAIIDQIKAETIKTEWIDTEDLLAELEEI